MNNNHGLYGKYIVTKADGTPIDPEARYFVLRPDADEWALIALKIYAVLQPNLRLRGELLEWLGELHDETV